MAQSLEEVLITGDLSRLTAEQRLEYYGRLCSSLGLNPLTRPFEYLVLSGKLTLYARKDATDQLRKLHGVSIERPEVIYSDDLVIVSVTARDAAGRSDSDLGAVAIAGLKGEARANAVMKALTKSKRRVTLSICGLGMLDESEVESIPGAVHVEEHSGPVRQLAAAPAGAEVLTESEAEMAVLREELAQWFERYPDTGRAAQALLAKEGKTRHGDNRVREMVSRLRARAAKEDQRATLQAAESAVVDAIPPESRLASAVELGRRLLTTVAGRPHEQPTAGDMQTARALLTEIQAVAPLSGDEPASRLEAFAVVPALFTRIMAENERTTPEAQTADEADPESVPF